MSREGGRASGVDGGAGARKGPRRRTRRGTRAGRSVARSEARKRDRRDGDDGEPTHVHDAAGVDAAPQFRGAVEPGGGRAPPSGLSDDDVAGPNSAKRARSAVHERAAGEVVGYGGTTWAQRISSDAASAPPVPGVDSSAAAASSGVGHGGERAGHVQCFLCRVWVPAAALAAHKTPSQCEKLAECHNCGAVVSKMRLGQHKQRDCVVKCRYCGDAVAWRDVAEHNESECRFAVVPANRKSGDDRGDTNAVVCRYCGDSVVRALLSHHNDTCLDAPWNRRAALRRTTMGADSRNWRAASLPRSASTPTPVRATKSESLLSRGGGPRLPCKWRCGEKFPGRDALAEHEGMCRLREVRCTTCGEAMPASLRRAHERSCDGRRECPFCRRLIRCAPPPNGSHTDGTDDAAAVARGGAGSGDGADADAESGEVRDGEEGPGVPGMDHHTAECDVANAMMECDDCGSLVRRHAIRRHRKVDCRGPGNTWKPDASQEWDDFEVHGDAGDEPGGSTDT